MKNKKTSDEILRPVNFYNSPVCSTCNGRGVVEDKKHNIAHQIAGLICSNCGTDYWVDGYCVNACANYHLDTKVKKVMKKYTTEGNKRFLEDQISKQTSKTTEPTYKYLWFSPLAGDELIDRTLNKWADKGYRVHTMQDGLNDGLDVLMEKEND